MYDSWDMVHGRCNRYFSYWATFLKKWKNVWKYHYFTNVYWKLSSDDVLFQRYGAWQMQFLFFILDYFLPFYSPNSPKNQNFEKMKKMPGNIIILHKCTKNYDEMMYGSWDMVHDRCNCYFSFWATFCTFTPLKPKKSKSLKKWKKCMEISLFYKCVTKIMTR